MFSAKDLFFTPPAGGYTIANSLRFRASASAYLSRTPASAGSLTTWTWSAWVKRGALGSAQNLFSADRAAAAEGAGIFFTASDTLQMYAWNGSAYVYNYITTQVFRDPSSWYHLVFVLDTSNATSTDRVRIYVNGVRITAFGTSSAPTSGASGYVNGTQAHALGRSNYNTSQYLDGYYSEVNFIDGQALDPTNFGQTDTATGVWMPKAYTGSYGTNGFYLKFDDVGATTTTNVGYGKDSSPNANRWQTNNFGTTSTSTSYDSMVDTPTNFDNGGNGAGNYCVLSPLNQSGGTVSNANLTLTASSSSVGSMILGSIGSSTDKYYFEVGITKTDAGYLVAGVQDVSRAPYATTILSSTPSYQWVWRDDAFRANNSASSSYGTAIASGGTLACAVDPAGGKIWWGSASGGTVTWFGSGDPVAGTNAAYTNLSGVVAPCVGTEGFVTAASVGNFNCGQRPFVGAAPSGFKALNTQNLTTPTIINGAQYMDATLYSGNGSSRTITGELFSPDLVWIKGRSGATDHALYDTVRGVQLQLESNNTGIETTESTGLTAFTSDGFTVGSLAQVNTNTATYVAWLWDAASSDTTIPVNAYGSTPSIASTVRANTTAGFSIVTYTGNLTAGATIGHGLGVAPKMVIVKDRDTSATDWSVYHASIGNTGAVRLNLTNATDTAVQYWNNTSPTSTVFSVGAGGFTNGSGKKIVAYCFADVAGYSAFGSYTGNGSADGPFVYLGFRPRYIMIKNTADNTTSWSIWDTARSTYNVPTERLEANASSAESSLSQFDLLSNGFKLRSNNSNNASGQTIIYAAFAESPFNYARAR